MSKYWNKACTGWAIALAFAAVLWFALGGTTHLLIASVLGKKIEIVVCSGAGVKKVMVLAQAQDDATTTVKHCSNAPFLKYAALPSAPVHLHFEAPRTVTSWQWTPLVDGVFVRIEDNKPPPGRAPPAAALA